MTERPSRAFISYAHVDKDRVDKIDSEIAARGVEVLRDQREISPSENWKGRLADLILKSDIFIFVLSSASAISAVCLWELKTALDQKKKLIIITLHAIKSINAPTELREIHWLHAHDEAAIGAAVDATITALNTDLAWTREHTRLGEAAARWRALKRSGTLLSGAELKSAEAWLNSPTGDLAAVTGDQRAYIATSRKRARSLKRVAFAALMLLVFTAAISVIYVNKVRHREAISSLREAVAAANDALTNGDAVTAVVRARAGLVRSLNLTPRHEVSAELERTLAEALRSSVEYKHTITSIAGARRIISSGTRLLVFGDDSGVELIFLDQNGDAARVETIDALDAFFVGPQHVAYRNKDRIFVINKNIDLPLYEAEIIDSQRAVMAAANFAPRLVWSGGDGIVHIVDVTKDDLISHRSIEFDRVADIALSTDGSTALVLKQDLVASLNQGTVKSWKNPAVKFLFLEDEKASAEFELPAYTDTVTALAISTKGDRAAIGTQTGRVEIYAAPSGKVVRDKPIVNLENAHRGHRTPVTELAFAPGSSLLASRALLEARAIVWDSNDGSRTGQIKGHAQTATGLTWLSDRHLATVGEDGFIHVWDAARASDEASPVATYSTEASAVFDIAASREMAGFWTVHGDRRLRLWQYRRLGQGRRLLVERSARGAAFLNESDASIVAATMGEKGLVEFDDNGVERGESVFENGFAVGLLPSADGERLVTYTYETSEMDPTRRTDARLWDPRRRLHVADLDGLGAMISGAYIEEQSGTVLLSSSNGAVGAWRAKDGAPLWRYGEAGGRAVVSGDHTQASVGFGNGTLLQLDLNTGVEIARQKAHSGPINKIEVLSDGTVISADSLGEIALWSRDSSLQTKWRRKFGSAILDLAPIDSHFGAAVLNNGEFVEFSLSSGEIIFRTEIGKECWLAKITLSKKDNRNKRAAIGCSHSNLIIYDFELHRIVDTIQVEPAGVSDISWRDDGAIAVSTNGSAIYLGLAFNSVEDILQYSSAFVKLRPLYLSETGSSILKLSETVGDEVNR